VIDAGHPELEADAAAEISSIAGALQAARAHAGQPTLVVVQTTIGFGSRKQNTGPIHGQALGDDEVAYVKEKFRLDPNKRFVVPESVTRAFAHVRPRGEAQQAEWEALAGRYKEAHPEEAGELERRMGGHLPQGWQKLLPSRDQLPTVPQPTRKSSGIVVEALASKFPDLVAGSADLLESTFVSWKGMVEFQKVSLTRQSCGSGCRVRCGTLIFRFAAVVWQPSSGLGDFSGRQIRYGIREVSRGQATSLSQSLPDY